MLRTVGRGGAIAATAALVGTLSACSIGGVDRVSVRGCVPAAPLIPAATVEPCGGAIVDATAARLVRIDERGEPVNELAEAITSSDNKVFTVRLRKDARFHDGTPVRAANFVDAWNHSAGCEQGFAGSTAYAPIAGFAAVHGDGANCRTSPAPATAMSGLKVVDDHTFTITLSQTLPGFPARLADRAYAALPDAYFVNPDGFAERPVGAGPFRVRQANTQGVLLDRFDDHVGPKAAAEGIDYRYYTELNAAYADVVSGDLDVTDDLPVDRVLDGHVARDVGKRRVQQPAAVLEGLALAPNDTSLDDVRLRRALGMALDRQLLVDQVTGGGRTPATSWVPAAAGGLPDTCGPTCTHNEEAARELWRQSGGLKSPIAIVVTKDRSQRFTATAMCNMWRNVLAVQCSVTEVADAKTLKQTLAGAGPTTFTIATIRAEQPTSEAFLRQAYGAAHLDEGSAKNGSRTATAGVTERSRTSATGTTPSAYEKLLLQADQLPAGERAEALRRDAQRRLFDTVPMIPLWTRDGMAVWSSHVRDVRLRADGTLDLTTVKR